MIMRQKKCTTRLFLTALVFFSCLSNHPVFSQSLDADNRVSVTLNDGTEVTLLGKANTRSNAPSGEYYYLPVGLRLSRRPDGVPEFLFMKYTTEAEASAGGVQGGLLHFLMQWGLTARQETELLNKLKEKLNEQPAKSRFGLRLMNTPKNIWIPTFVGMT